MEAHKFKKAGGGRGKPPRDSICSVCGVIWTEHPKLEIKKAQTKPKAIAAKPVKAGQDGKAEGRKKPRPVAAKPRPQPLNKRAWSLDPVAPQEESPDLSPEEKAKRDKEEAEHCERIFNILKEAWISVKIKNHPEQGDRAYWSLKYDEEAEAVSDL